MRSTRSLSFVVAAWSAVAVAVSMAVYAVVQYVQVPALSPGQLIFEHVWHVLVLAGVIYVLVWLVLRQVVLRPIRRINLHLRLVGAGRLEPLTGSTGVREIDAIVDGVNEMIRRLKAKPSSEHLGRELTVMRDAARAAYERAPDEAQTILDHLARLHDPSLGLQVSGPATRLARGNQGALAGQRPQTSGWPNRPA